MLENMTSEQVKDKVKNVVVGAFDTAHRVADVVTFPLAPVDGAIHGAAIGISNWLLDKHPGEEDKCGPPAPVPCNKNNSPSPPQPTPGSGVTNNTNYGGQTNTNNGGQNINNQGTISPAGSVFNFGGNDGGRA